MPRESIIVSPYDTREAITPGSDKNSLTYFLVNPDHFQQRIETAYGTIAERGGKIVLEQFMKLKNEPNPADMGKYSSWGGPIEIEPSLVIIADFPDEPNPHLNSYAPTE